MKRKALLMGMAVMASMPGWALAKGGSKADRAQHPYSSAWEVPETAEGDDMGMRSGSRAGQLLTEIKDTLRRTNYGAPVRTADDVNAWKMEMLDVKAETNFVTETLPQRNKPVGVSFRLSF